MALSVKKFGDTYDKYVDKIYRFVFLKVNSQATAQDLTSEVFARALEYLRRNPSAQIDNIQAFLYRSARNIVTDYYRQKSRADVPLDYESKDMVSREAPDRERPDWLAGQNESMSQIRTALAKMGGEAADVVMWHYVEDMSIRDIAKMLNRPKGTVRVMLHRGLKEIREVLNSPKA